MSAPSLGPWPFIPDQSEETPEQRIQARAAVQGMVDLWLYITTKNSISGFDHDVMTTLKLLDATGHPASADGKIKASLHPTVHWELPISPSYANLNNVMHGGAAGVIFDMCTMSAMCPIQRPGYWDFMAGVTRNLNISYLKGVPLPQENRGNPPIVRIRCWVVQHGRTMALIKGEMTDVSGKIVYATCEHHKVHVPSLPEHLKLREEMRRKSETATKDTKSKL